MRKQTKLVAVLSAAALLAIGASMTSFAAAGWAEEDGTWVYLDKDGDRTYDTWKKSGNQHFYLDENGEMATERIVETDGEKYYVDANGAKVVNAWISVDNEDDIEIGENEVDTLWYYFGSNGKATRATNGDKKVKELTYGGGKAKFIFNTDGQMLSGWQTNGTDLYYLGDENQGWALTGWQQLEPSDDANEAYDDLKWFYFDGGKAVKGKTKYIKGAYYSFESDGTMVDDWFTASTPPAAASGADAYASGSGALGLGWIYTTEPNNSDSDPHWYYLVNLRSGNDVSRSIPYNYKGDTMMAKSIKSKTYLFDTNGQMLTGVKVLPALPASNKVAKDGKALLAGTYYFNKGDGSVKGQMVKGKATVETDGENDYYYFDKTTGQALMDEVKDGCLYGPDGKRINAEDGNTNSTHTLVNTVTYKKGTTAQGTIPAGTQVIVSSTGKIKESGNIKIEDITYKVTNYVAVAQ